MVGRPQRYEEFYSGTVRYGIFAKSRYTGIFRYGISLIFSSRDFWKLFGIFRYFFIGAISDQFRDFSQLLGLLCECLTFLGVLASLDLVLSVSQ